MTPKQEYQKLYRERTKEKRQAYHKIYQEKYYKENIDKYILWQVAAKCRKNNIPFDLEVSDVLVPSHCPILKIPLFRNVGKNGPCSNSPSIDRIDPSKGYIKGNIQIISQRANVMKNDASYEELKEFANWINNSIPW